MQKCPSMLASQSRPMNRGVTGLSSLMPRARSSGHRRYYICTCQHLEEAIKHCSRAWNAKCLQLRRDRLAARTAHGRRPLCRGHPLFRVRPALRGPPVHPPLAWGSLRPGVGVGTVVGGQDRCTCNLVLGATPGYCWLRQAGTFWKKPKWAE